MSDLLHCVLEQLVERWGAVAVLRALLDNPEAVHRLVLSHESFPFDHRFVGTKGDTWHHHFELRFIPSPTSISVSFDGEEPDPKLPRMKYP